MCKQLVWDVTVVVALAPSRLKQGSLCNPGTTATESGERKIEKYRELIDNGYSSQPVALKYRVLWARAVKFSSRVSVKCCRSHDDQRAGSFLKQRISKALQIGNAACSRNCERQRCVRRNLLHIVYFPYVRCRPRVCVFSPPNMVIHMALD